MLTGGIDAKTKVFGESAITKPEPIHAKRSTAAAQKMPLDTLEYTPLIEASSLRIVPTMSGTLFEEANQYSRSSTLLGEVHDGVRAKSSWRTRSQISTKVAADVLEDVAAWVYLNSVFKEPSSAWLKPLISGAAWGLSGMTRCAHYAIYPREERSRINIAGSASNGLAGIGDATAVILSKQGASDAAVTAAQQTGNGCWLLSGAATVYDEAPKLLQHLRGMREEADAQEGASSALPLVRSAVRTTAGLMQIAGSVTGMAAQSEASAICWALGSTGDTAHTALGSLGTIGLVLKYVAARCAPAGGAIPS